MVKFTLDNQPIYCVDDEKKDIVPLLVIPLNIIQ